MRTIIWEKKLAGKNGGMMLFLYNELLNLSILKMGDVYGG